MEENMDKTAKDRLDRCDQILAALREDLARYRRNTDAILAEGRADIARQREQQK
jgi:hypothetical protein